MHRDERRNELLAGLERGRAHHNINALMVSTHYPSNVTADDGGPIYYQQQC